MKYFYWLLITIVLLIGCASLPTQTVWHPWTRIEVSSEDVIVPSTFSISFSGSAVFLVGDYTLTQQALKADMLVALERRGFSISDTDPDYRILVKCNIERTQRLTSVVTTGQRTYFRSKISTPMGLGVLTADTIAKNTTVSSSTTTARTDTRTFYLYTMAINIFSGSNPVWQGNATWESQALLPQQETIYAFRLLTSYLPRDEEHIPIVPLVKDSHADNYYKLYIRRQIFSCPALPYRITVSDEDVSWGLGDIFKPKTALAAYLDLINTAEYCLPRGLNQIDDPFDQLIWTKVQLGARYLIGDSNTPSNVLITLVSNLSGYMVQRAQVVDEEEFQQFMTGMDAWRNILKEYYDVYQ